MSDRRHQQLLFSDVFHAIGLAVAIFVVLMMIPGLFQ
jgi:hypothetical protein